VFKHCGRNKALQDENEEAKRGEEETKTMTIRPPGTRKLCKARIPKPVEQRFPHALLTTTKPLCGVSS
jgi:hypothetical protein